MAVGIEAGALHHGVHLVPQIGDASGRTGIGGRGEQADDAHFAGELAVRIEALDADIVHVDAPVHARAQRGLGHDQQLRLVQERPDLGRELQRTAPAAQHLELARAHHPEPGLEHGIEPGVLGEHVIAHAEKGEIVGQQPVQELDGFGNFVDRQRRRVAPDIGNRVDHARGHGAPVLNRSTHVGEHRLERGHDLCALRLIVDALDMEMDEALAQRAGHVLPSLKGDKPAGRIAA